MPTFTVHEPPSRKGESIIAPERFVFIRDGFHFWAFVLGPVWLFVRRLWLALLIYAVFLTALELGLKIAGASSSVQSFTALVLAIAVGLEAATIWRWTLSRRGWKMLGFVVAEDVEIAERRFYAEWLKQDGPRADDKPPEPNYGASAWHGKSSSSEVIGLFPEPGATP